MLILRTVTYFIAHYVLIGLFVNFIAQILFYIYYSVWVVQYVIFHH